ncbi:centrosomal protein of 162 kDa [Diretmus argenteus]
MSHPLTKEELDEQFELFLKESVSDDSVDLGGAVKPQSVLDSLGKAGRKAAQKTAIRAAPRWQDDDDDSEGGSGRAEKAKSRFIKVQKSEAERTDEGELRESPAHQDSMAVSDLVGNMAPLGLDTLEEEEEKAMFFAQLEAEACSTIDYSKLNRDLDSTSTTMDTTFRKVEEAAEQRDAGVTQTDSPGSPHYSDDFEDEGSEGKEEEEGEEPPEEKPERTLMLAKVSLHDSLDSTGGEVGRKDPAGSLTKGQSYVQSGGSEVEALHEAYRNIRYAVDGSDDNNHRHSSIERRGRSSRPVSPSSSPQHSRLTLQPASTAESDLPTAEELMRPIRPERGHVRGFFLQPSSGVEPDLEKTPGPLERSSPEPIPRRPQEVDPALGSGPTWLHWPLYIFGEEAHCGSSQSKKNGGSEPGPQASGELIASVRSFTAFLQHQIDASDRHNAAVAREVGGRQEAGLMQQREESRQEEERSVVDELRVQLAQKETELQLMQQHKDELNSLRQHNYVLQSKLRSAEENVQKRRQGDATDPNTEEQLTLMEKEMLEQETLIKGYQQENEKLYLQMKAQQSKNKADQEAMFAENQRLLNELASAKEQFNKTPRSVGNVCLMDHTQRITELLAQMNTVQRNEAELSEETRRLKQEKQVLEVDLQLMKKERDLAKAQVASGKTDRGPSFEMRIQEDRHREEVAALKKKLQWFAENQELLDRDAARLKAATAETQQLKEQVEKLKTDVKTSDRAKQQNKAKERERERAGDAKRIHDLEQQVKQLEQILRCRNPNSLPALIYAAASAGGPEDPDLTASETSPPGRVSALLERRVQRLEAELENHDEEAKRSLRALEQQFQRIKLQYEQQISELEQQLEQKLEQKQHSEAAAASETCESQVQTLEEELRRAGETHQDREKSLQDKIQSLQQQLNQKAQPSPSRQQRQAETASGVRIDRLNQELAAKTRTIQDLNRTVERLQRERKNMLSGPSLRKEACSGNASRQPASSKTSSPADPGEGCGGEETFPATQYEKDYQPTTFTGSHISEVLQENEELRERLELLELQKEREKEALKAAATQAQDELRRLKESSAEQSSSMKAEHLRVLDRLRATQALEHSSSKVAQLTNKVNTQEITLRHLRDEVKELQRTKEALVVSKIREETLQNQVTRLLEELRRATDAHSPELKHFISLERKILHMELRHQQRGKELQQVMGGSWQAVEVDQRPEVERWRSLAQEKSRELEVFRLELDSILDVLRQLHRQGVVLPCPAPPNTKY